ncbi:MAG: rhomboid family intramembrane serine protease [bacterium]|nr:rhomboid family intramembrane serine protease [bacterium]
MRSWYRYTEKTDDYRTSQVITPFQKVWGFGAPVTIWLIAVNAGIWLVMIITSMFGWLDLYKFWYGHFALIPSMVVHGHVYQLLTNIFLHSEDLLHLFFNMYLLWVFGPRVERTFSSRMFLAFYLVAGIGGSLLSFAMRAIPDNPILYNSPSLGASGAVFGILVAYGFLFSKDKLLLFFVIPIEAWKAVIGFIIIESLFVIFGFMPNVDHWAHLGGAAAAAVWMLILIYRTGNKTEHGWHHTGRRGTTADGFWVGPVQKSPSGKNFRVIIGRKSQFDQGRKSEIPDEHPEGTDNEPPPDWFKL